MNTVKSIVTETILKFLNEGSKNLNVKGLGIQSGFDVPIKNPNKPLPKMLKPSKDDKLPSSLAKNIGLNEKQKKLEEFLKNLKVNLSENNK